MNQRKHAFRAWFCFFLSVNILLAFLITIPFALLHPDIREYTKYAYGMTFTNRVRDTNVFRMLVAKDFEALLDMLEMEGDVHDIPNRYSPAYITLENESTNIACSVTNGEGKVIYDTIPLPEKNISYNLLFVMTDGSLKLYRSDSGNIIDEYRAGILTDKAVLPGPEYELLLNYFDNFIEQAEDPKDVTILLAIRSDFRRYENSLFYRLDEFQLYGRIAAAICGALLLAALLLLLFSIVKRQEKSRFLDQFAAVVRRVWLEFKLLAAAIVAYGVYAVITEILCYPPYGIYPEQIIGIVLLDAALWFFYFLMKDLAANGSEFFRHNSIRAASRAIVRLSKRLHFEKRMLVGFWVLMAAELILAVLFLASLPVGVLSLLFALIGIVLFVFAVRRYFLFVSDSGKVVSQISRMKAGDLHTPLSLGEDSDFFDCSIQLNTLQSGLSAAVAEQLASQRMKVDLITNVSHDLKTPLTSIIGYIDLLEKEELSPQARDYVQVLSRKAQRLKEMIQDVFDVTKATSGNLPVQEETLDLKRLVGQTVADMREKIDASGLYLRTFQPDEPLYITSDGQKLYRVFQNLIDNALRYSLPGSRIFIRLETENGCAVAEVKNTAMYEPDFSPQEITERFVRGDKSRSGEGSGLGLSIAESFTTACGGTFGLSLQDDVFKVRLSFPLAPPPPVAAAPVDTPYEAPVDTQAKTNEVTPLTSAQDSPPAISLTEIADPADPSSDVSSESLSFIPPETMPEIPQDLQQETPSEAAEVILPDHNEPAEASTPQ